MGPISDSIGSRPTAPNWVYFCQYLHDLPLVPEMEGAKTMSEVYDKAKTTPEQNAQQGFTE